MAPAKTAAPTPSTASDTSGAWVVFQRFDPAIGLRLRLIRTDGTDEHELLTTHLGNETHPDWSPDGTRIAYVVDDKAIWVVNLDGTNPTKLPIPCPDSCNLNDLPAWSPDGTSIAFSRLVYPAGADPYTDVAAIDLATGTIRTLYTPPAGEGTFYVRWAPDGRSIVVDINRYPSIDSDTVVGGVVAVVDVTQPNPIARALTDWSSLASDPDWSPDGSRIVFCTNDLGVRDYGNQQDPKLGSDLYTIHPDGTNLARLTANPTSETLIRNATASGPLSCQPTWTSDGHGIVYTFVDGPVWPGYQIWAMNGDGNDAHSLLTTPLVGTHPRLRPGSALPR